MNQFEKWCYQKMSINKNVLLNWYSSMKKKYKDPIDFWNRKLPLKVKLWHFLTPPHYTNSQNSIIFFGYVVFWQKSFLILYTPLGNSTIGIAINVHSLSFQFYPLLILETHNSRDAQDPLDYKQQGLCPPAPVPDHPQQPDESKSGMEKISCRVYT